MTRLRLKGPEAGTSDLELETLLRSEGMASDLVGPVAGWLMPILRQGADRAELIDVLVSRIEDLDPERAADDVDALLERLRELDLLEEV